MSIFGKEVILGELAPINNRNKCWIDSNSDPNSNTVTHISNRRIKMHFNSIICQEEYERHSINNPDVQDLSHPLINVSDVLKAYYSLADYFTDPDAQFSETMLVGIRSADLLYSAIGRQTVSYAGKRKYTDPIDICSTLFFGLVKNHAFSDGNKRTALLILLYQLWLFNYYPAAPIHEFEKLVVATAANSLPNQYEYIWKKHAKDNDPLIETISHILRRIISRKDHRYHLKVTTRKFVDALLNHNVKVEVSSGKLHFERYIPRQWFKKAEVYRYAIPFGGWTRCIGASTARDVLNHLRLYDQFPNYQTFIDGNEAFYSFIQEFEGPFRRLKDE